MNPLDTFGIDTLPDEQIVVSRTDYPERDGEVAGITTQRFIAIGTAWPGPSLFGYTVLIKSCRKVEYKEHYHLASLIISWLFVLAGIGGCLFGLQRQSFWLVWFFFFALLFVIPVVFNRLFCLQSKEISFHCEKEVLRWSFNWKNRTEAQHILSTIRQLAERMEIEISNFPKT